MKNEDSPSKSRGAGELCKKVEKVYRNMNPQTIQKGFMRSYSRNEKGDLDESLIPESFTQWYLDEESDVSDFECYIEDDEVLYILNLRQKKKKLLKMELNTLT